MNKAGIAGATGYIGYELITLIHRHPELEVGWLTSERNAGKRFDQIFSTPWDYPLINLESAYLRTDEVDVVFLCLPHAESMEAVRRFYGAGVRVIDLSADFRLKDVDVYERWYGVEHSAPELCAEARYGLCELYRGQLDGAQLIANPGCYPTSVNLGLYPLAKAGWLGERVIIDSMSGVSGAGRKTNLTYQFVEANENITPYNVGHRHRHIAEMEQVLGAANGGQRGHRFLFTPHLVPVNRGILSTMYVDVPAGVTEERIRELYAENYAGEPFIHLLPQGEQASLAHTAGTNRCAIGITQADPLLPDGGEYVITASIDNLIKGGSGQAVQNYNIAVGLDETAGLQ
ncbi:MAG: N-acetyl-gamma-glutamyl-phosphate reductase [Caldilineaceae bacterium SB0661_bin_32]|uniref:N-acetyl-gamma-glutamyl-phosphate reductase n=1 Tax=Caldilineaceae bacterium SB0661_bin_32 TaxID=2605255 RepID=A0A6B1DD07_9CHLR|nr:N-acetyl-gamma-glutamyl-phosphate reductase [Caldilineaceae bacterium SB0661_bin_32]